MRDRIHGLGLTQNTEAEGRGVYGAWHGNRTKTTLGKQTMIEALILGRFFQFETVFL